MCYLQHARRHYQSNLKQAHHIARRNDLLTIQASLRMTGCPTCVYLYSIAAATNIVLDDDPLLCGLLLLLRLNGLCSIANDMRSLRLCVCALHRPRDPMSHQKLSYLQ